MVWWRFWYAGIPESLLKYNYMDDHMNSFKGTPSSFRIPSGRGRGGRGGMSLQVQLANNTNNGIERIIRQLFLSVIVPVYLGNSLLSTLRRKGNVIRCTVLNMSISLV